MLVHQFVAAHRREILQACNEAVHGQPHAEQVAHYANALFDEMLRFLETRIEQTPEERPREVETTKHGIELEAVIGASAQMRRTRVAIEQLARRSRSPVLLLGEFGTGKRHCARVLHAVTFPEGEFFELDVERPLDLEQRIWSLRNLASAPAAAGLTVYVQELTETPAPLQLALLRLLSERGLNLRLIVASNRALSQAAREGLVRSELAFGFPNQLELPPLRDRIEDVAELARHFAELSALRRGSSPTLLGESALSRMRDYAWPGNLAELVNVLEQLTDNFGPRLVEAEDLPQLDERASGMSFHLPARGIDFAVLERELLVQALVMAGNNQTRAARLLGLSRDQLRYRLMKFEIPSNLAQG